MIKIGETTSLNQSRKGGLEVKVFALGLGLGDIPPPLAVGIMLSGFMIFVLLLIYESFRRQQEKRERGTFEVDDK